ncbi:hypothetical protein Dimus_007655, partial [Dionaea muscipula]
QHTGHGRRQPNTPANGRRRSKSACDRVMAASPAPLVLDSGDGGGLRLGNGGGLRLVLACDGGPRLGDGGGLRLGFGGGLRLGDYGGLCGSARAARWWWWRPVEQGRRRNTAALVFNGESGGQRPWLPWMFLRERERHRDLGLLRQEGDDHERGRKKVEMMVVAAGRR